MSTEEKPLPDFSGGIPTGLPVRPVTTQGPPRGPVKPEPASAFSITEADEVSRTLDFGMSEEDMLDDSDGEGSSSELHDSLRALHGKSGVVEEDFSSLMSDYASGIREEDSYSKPAIESDFELPDLNTPAPVFTPELSQSLPDFSKYDEVEEVKETVKPNRSTPIEEIAEPKKKFPLKVLLVIAAAVVGAVVVWILLTLPGSGAPAVIAPAVDQIAHLLR